MKIAHLIFVHKDPEQLERLLQRILSVNSDIYIHVDKKVNINSFKSVSNYPNIFFIKNRISINWANYTMVEAILTGLEEIVNSDKEYSHINLLSGQDHPLRKIEEFEKHLANHEGKSFIQFLSIKDEWHDAKERLTKYSLGDWKIPFKYIIQDFINKYLPSRIVPNKLEPFGWSSWFTITPISVKYVLNYLKSNPNVKNYFKYTWGADEIIFQTILVNSFLKDTIINDNLRYIVFENKSPNPKIFTIDDLDVLVNSGKFFARKFSIQVDIQILDELDKSIFRNIN